MHTYRKTEQKLWTVGFVNPECKFEPKQDFDTKIKAIAFTNYLNGGSQDISIIKAILYE